MDDSHLVNHESPYRRCMRQWGRTHKKDELCIQHVSNCYLITENVLLLIYQNNHYPLSPWLPAPPSFYKLYKECKTSHKSVRMVTKSFKFELFKVWYDSGWILRYRIPYIMLSWNPDISAEKPKQTYLFILFSYTQSLVYIKFSIATSWVAFPSVPKCPLRCLSGPS